jgi:hypothetical protein
MRAAADHSLSVAVSVLRFLRHRYIKTFPEGGLWKGKNYLFDRRLEQVPDCKPPALLAADVESRCVLCRCLWAEYRGKHACASTAPLCGVPVLVCSSCQFRAAGADKPALRCDLCREGYQAPSVKPDLRAVKARLQELDRLRTAGLEPGGAAGKRPSEAEPGAGAGTGAGAAGSRKRRRLGLPVAPVAACRRLWVGRMPFVVTRTQLAAALATLPGVGPAAVEAVQWCHDRATGLFYGAALVQMRSLAAAQAAVAAANTRPPPPGTAAARAQAPAGRKGDRAAAAGRRGREAWGLQLGGRRLRVEFAPTRPEDVWPPAGPAQEMPRLV